MFEEIRLPSESFTTRFTVEWSGILVQLTNMFSQVLQFSKCFIAYFTTKPFFSDETFMLRVQMFVKSVNRIKDFFIAQITPKTIGFDRLFTFTGRYMKFICSITGECSFTVRAFNCLEMVFNMSVPFCNIGKFSVAYITCQLFWRCYFIFFIQIQFFLCNKKKTKIDGIPDFR